MSKTTITAFCTKCGSYAGTNSYCPQCGASIGFIYIEPNAEAKIIMQQQEKIAELQARIDELTHKNEVLMDSYLESETIDDKGKLVGSLQYFRQRIADLEKQLKSYKDFCSAIEREE
jgi:ribosomal protein L32